MRRRRAILLRNLTEHQGGSLEEPVALNTLKESDPVCSAALSGLANHSSFSSALLFVHAVPDLPVIQLGLESNGNARIKRKSHSVGRLMALRAKLKTTNTSHEFGYSLSLPT